MTSTGKLDGPQIRPLTLKPGMEVHGSTDTRVYDETQKVNKLHKQ